jgi:NADH:ubiquinone oxidoreductase subunit C
VDTSDLIPKLEAVAPGAILEARPFGRSGALSLWIEMRAIEKVARALRDDEALGLDWLENLSAMEFEGAIVLNYFLRSTSALQGLFVLRGSVLPESPESETDVGSVRAIWPMAEAFEREIADLFGIRFAGNPKADPTGKRGLLPEGWVGYPLRKNYVFPMEYLDIPHARPAGQTGPDEFGVPS